MHSVTHKLMDAHFGSLAPQSQHVLLSERKRISEEGRNDLASGAISLEELDLEDFEPRLERSDSSLWFFRKALAEGEFLS